MLGTDLVTCLVLIVLCGCSTVQPQVCTLAATVALTLLQCPLIFAVRISAKGCQANLAVDTQRRSVLMACMHAVNVVSGAMVKPTVET